NLPSSSPDSSSSAGVTRPAPVRSPPPCPSLIPCSNPASRLPHDSSKHNFLDKCPNRFLRSPPAACPCPDSGPPPVSAAACFHPATASLLAPGSRPSRRTSPSTRRSCAWTRLLPAPHLRPCVLLPAASAPRSSALLCACSPTSFLPLPFVRNHTRLCAERRDQVTLLNDVGGAVPLIDHRRGGYSVMILPP